MAYSEEHDEDFTDGDDIALDERKLAALSVIDSATESGWFTDEQLDAALLNSSLEGEFVLSLDEKLDANPGRKGGLGKLHDAFASYVRLDIDAIAHAKKARRSRPHAFVFGRGSWCAYCGGAMPGHREAA